MMDNMLSLPVLLAVTSALIEADANINAQLQGGDTPLHYAATEGRLTVTCALIEAGADVNAAGRNGDTPLHEATSESTEEIMAMLIEAGADVNARNHDGRTPLYWTDLGTEATLDRSRS